jgi:hypothetical protein
VYCILKYWEMKLISRLFFFTIFFLISFLNLSCKKNGEYKTYDSNGTLILIQTYKNGKLEGSFHLRRLILMELFIMNLII